MIYRVLTKQTWLSIYQKEAKDVSVFTLVHWLINWDIRSWKREVDIHSYRDMCGKVQYAWDGME